MDDNELKKLAKEISGNRPKKPHGKSNRTLSLSEPEFTTLQRYCRSRGYKVSQVIDKLIAMFLKEVEGEIDEDQK